MTSHPFFRLGFCVALAAMLAPVPRAFAQEERDPSEAARFRFGALRFTPSIAVRSIGIDDNVFNEAENPKQDNTAAIGPATDLWMRVGPSRLAGRVTAEYLYFNKYANQRAWNTTDDLRWDVPLARITPFVAGAYSNTKTRPGYEIDSRVRQMAHEVTLGSEAKLTGKVQLLAAVKRARVQFADNDFFGGESLAGVLNEWVNTEQLRLRYRMTSLTSFLVNAEAIQDRFDQNHLRDANSIRVMPGFEMKPAALISGKVYVGYRDLEPLQESVPRFRSLVSAVDAIWIARATKVVGKVNRDTAYSYQPLQPYYLLTDAKLEIIERITYVWDVVARGGYQKLDYRLVSGAPSDLEAQVDHLNEYGGGIGFRIGRTLRLGVDAEYYRRRSSNPIVGNYKGLRAGASISYGLPQ